MILFVDRVFKYFARNVIPFIVRVDKNKIIFVTNNNSGCNARVLYRLSEQHKYSLELFHSREYDDNSIISYIRKTVTLSKANLIITTHGTIGLRGRNELNTWHSVHLKATGVMENPTEKFIPQTSWQKVDVILSYSQFYTTTMNACFVTNPYKFRITGMPRNDLLFLSNGKKNLEGILNMDLTDKKVICYMPTFRLGYSKEQGSKKLTNLFGFDEINEERLSKYLSENGLILLYKLHPNEESMFGLYANNINNCFRLDSEILSQNELDLYDVLNGVDLLMTDYSGVYFDFLLLNRPIIFLPVDLDEYVKTRGFLVDPYEEWTPGPKVVSQDHMELELLKSLDDSDYFNKDRIRLRNIIHSYKDSSSTKRVWKVIDELMNDDI